MKQYALIVVVSATDEIRANLGLKACIREGGHEVENATFRVELVGQALETSPKTHTNRMKYKVSFTGTKLGFFGDTVIPGTEIIEATDIESAWKIAKQRSNTFSIPGELIITLNDVQPLSNHSH